MIWKALKKFRDRTYDQYEKRQQEGRPEWMNRVMEIHERAAFLFYYEESPEADIDGGLFIVKGQLVKGRPEIQTPVFLYSGEGDLLGEGRILSSPEETQEERQGLLKRKRQVFTLEVTGLEGRIFSGLAAPEKRKGLRDLARDLSLITETGI